MENTLYTEKQAYVAMQLFLEKYWNIGEKSSDDIGNLLCSLDGAIDADMPRDTALWEDWKKCLLESVNG